MAQVRPKLHDPVLEKVVIELDPQEARSVMNRLLLRGPGTGDVNLKAREVGGQIRRALEAGNVSLDEVMEAPEPAERETAAHPAWAHPWELEPPALKDAKGRPVTDTGVYDLRVSGQHLRLLNVAIHRGLSNIAGPMVEHTLRSARRSDHP